MNIWGVPPAGTSEAAAFWASFWPALWSGAIYGVICGVISGLVVGIVVLRYQRGWEARVARRSYERDLSLLLDDLRNALYEPEVVKISSARESLPVEAAAALTRLKSTPLSLWRDHLLTKASLIDAALDLQKRAAEFVGAATELDNRLIQLARSYNHARHTVANHDAPIRQYAIGRILGFDREQLLPWLPETGINELTPFEDVWQSFAAEPAVRALGARVVECRNAVMNQGHVLQRALDA
jgi:hypothetical protein